MFSHEHLVTFEDTHVMGGVYFANYLRWQGHCRERFLVDHAPGVLESVRSGELVLVTLFCSCEYLAELRVADRVRVEMSLAAMQGNRMDLRFDYLRLQGDADQLEPVAYGRNATACMRRDGDQLEPVSIPDELVQAIHAVMGNRGPVPSVRR